MAPKHKFYNLHRPKCRFCSTLRIVISMSIMTLVIASIVFDMRIFSDIAFTDSFASVIGILFLSVLGWRIWNEYLKK